MSSLTKSFLSLPSPPRTSAPFWVSSPRRSGASALCYGEAAAQRVRRRGGCATARRAGRRAAARREKQRRCGAPFKVTGIMPSQQINNHRYTREPVTMSTSLTLNTTDVIIITGNQQEYDIIGGGINNVMSNTGNTIGSSSSPATINGAGIPSNK